MGEMESECRSSGTNGAKQRVFEKKLAAKLLLLL